MLYLSLFPFPPSHEIHRPTLKSSADAQRYSSMANNKHPPPPIPCRLQIDFHPPPTPPHTAYPHPQHLIFLETPHTLAWQDALFHAHRPLCLSNHTMCRCQLRPGALPPPYTFSFIYVLGAQDKSRPFLFACYFPFALFKLIFRFLHATSLSFSLA